MNLKVEDDRVLFGKETIVVDAANFEDAKDLLLGRYLITNGFVSFSAEESLEIANVLTDAGIAFVNTTIVWSTSTTNAVVGKQFSSRSDAIAQITGTRTPTLEERMKIAEDILLLL